jgi:hypothetical protein
MDTANAFARGDANRHKPLMVFDWDKAAKIIRDKKPEYAIAGLQSDLEWTAGRIYEDGKPMPQEETYTYLASTWATPVLIIDDIETPCYKMQDETPGWDSHTYWPDSALKHLNEE